MTKSNKDLLIIDLDFTLIKTNSTLDFLRFITPMRYHVFCRILKPIIFLNKLLEIDVYKFLLVLLCIKGKSKEILRKYARKYYYHVKKKGYINNKLLMYVRSMDKRTILLTASLDFIAENFKDLGFDAVIGSKTCYKNGKFKYLIDLYSKKHKILQSLSRHYRSVIVIEDLPEKEYSTIPNVRLVSVKEEIK